MAQTYLFNCWILEVFFFLLTADVFEDIEYLAKIYEFITVDETRNGKVVFEVIWRAYKPAKGH